MDGDGDGRRGQDQGQYGEPDTGHFEHVEALPESAEVVVLHDLHGQVGHRDAVGEGHVVGDEVAPDLGDDGCEVDGEGVTVAGGEGVEERGVGGAVGRVPGGPVGGGAGEGVQGLAEQGVHADLEGARVDLAGEGAGDLGDDDLLHLRVLGEGGHGGGVPVGVAQFAVGPVRDGARGHQKGHEHDEYRRQDGAHVTRECGRGAGRERCCCGWVVSCRAAWHPCAGNPGYLISRI